MHYLKKHQVSRNEDWARVSLGDVEVLVSDISVIEKAYKYAVAVSENNWFDLDSSRQQLLILGDI